MKHYAISVGLMLMLAMPVSARLTFTQKLQQKGRVMLRQDKDLDLLVNGREEEHRPTPNQRPPSRPPIMGEAKEKPPHYGGGARKGGGGLGVSGTRTTYTTQAGWRVKFFTGGSSRTDKEQAQAAGRDFKRAFPDVPVYMHFVSPHWICVAGDFVNKEDADAFIAKIRSTGQFNTAGMTVMKSRVKVPVE